MLLLQIHDLSMAFGGVQALFSVNIDVDEGEIFALIGPNGSGKSTTLNCINGFYRPQGGEILLGKKPLVGMPTHRVMQMGVARTFQNLELFNHMKVIDNVLVGLHAHIQGRKFIKGIWKGRFVESWEWSKDRAFEIMDFLGISSFHNKVVGGLPFGIQKLVELARALCMRPQLLLLDEPSAGMNEQETHEMSKLIQEIREEMGITIMMVEHDMNLVIGISDRVCVLDSGRVIYQGLPEAASRDEKVIEAYLGKEDDLAEAGGG
jgi:branched-chain amino acid transport system ATP-binding protein